MKQIIHVIIGSPENKKAFKCLEDEFRAREYIRIYKDRLHIDVLAFSFTQEVVHLILYDREQKTTQFLTEVKEAYTYYYSIKYDTELRLQSRKYPLESSQEFIKLLRFVHSKGHNSSTDYDSYSRYIGHELLNIGAVFHTLSTNIKEGKEIYQREMLKENPAHYDSSLHKKERFKTDKMSKRRTRASQFLEDFLEAEGLSLDELFRDEHFDSRRRLVEKFRDETDLSFRDIGHVLGISHTSVIRLLRMN